MGMLDRYRKPGGFLQLLNLIETSGPQKQAKFLEIVKEEDPRWAEMMSEKLLSMQKICGWNNEALMEVVANLQILSLAVMLHGLDEPNRDRFTTAMSNSQKRNVMEHFNASQPSAAEISSTFSRVITDVRKMISDGRLRMDRIDPKLVVEEGIEEALKKSVRPMGDNASSSFSVAMESSTRVDSDSAAEFHPYPETISSSASMAPSGTSNPPNGAGSSESILLKKKLTILSNENSILKQEVLRLRGKLEQIKKIA